MWGARVLAGALSSVMRVGARVLAGALSSVMRVRDGEHAAILVCKLSTKTKRRNFTHNLRKEINNPKPTVI